jgi:nucleoside-diphosphate-sugar epimerase
MHVFVTGASGFIGSAIVTDLQAAGHKVIGLARSEASAQTLLSRGVQVHRGDLEDLDSLRGGAAAAQAVIHTAFIHDFSRYKEVCEADRRAIAALGAVLAGTKHPLIVASGTGRNGTGQIRREDDTVSQPSSVMPRMATEEAVKAGQQRQSVYIGEGSNRWAAVHRLDAARLFALALEKGEAGAIYHAVAEEGIPLREIAEAIASRLSIPLVAQTPEEAATYFGPMAPFMSADLPASSSRTRERLGWQPTHPGLLADLAQLDISPQPAT